MYAPADTRTGAATETFITAQQLADELGMARSTIYHLAARKKNPMPHHRFAGVIRFRLTEVLAWAGGHHA